MTTTTWLILSAVWVIIALGAGILAGKAMHHADTDTTKPAGGEVIELDEHGDRKPPMTPGHPDVTWHEWWWEPPGPDDPRMN